MSVELCLRVHAVWQAFAPMSSYGTKATQKLAGLYCLRVSLQGSGSKRFIMVRFARPLYTIVG